MSWTLTTLCPGFPSYLTDHRSLIIDLFNIDLCDFFLLVNNIDIANYADGNTP